VTGATALLKSVDESIDTSVSVTEFPFFIGKLRENVDYCLQKSVVSRYHAKITKEEDKYYITDLNSTNGTYVNETKLNPYENKELKQGDRVDLADLTFEFVLH
jgi:pSer/pThr/pTyr-binding forkhead associated (FHA) protein